MKTILSKLKPDAATLTQTGFLMIVALILAAAINTINPLGINLFKKCDKNKLIKESIAKKQADLQQKEVPDQEHSVPEAFLQSKLEIDGGLAYEFHQDGILFVDARDSRMYKEHHIKGAVSLPIKNAPAQMDGFFTQHDPSTPLVVYCSGEGCSDSHHLAELLLSYGYEYIRIYTGGMPEWKERGYPTEGAGQ